MGSRTLPKKHTFRLTDGARICRIMATDFVSAAQIAERRQMRLIIAQSRAQNRGKETVA